jgi:hypothetical protein
VAGVAHAAALWSLSLRERETIRLHLDKYYHHASDPNMATPVGKYGVPDILIATLIRPTRCNYLQNNRLGRCDSSGDCGSGRSGSMAEGLIVVFYSAIEQPLAKRKATMNPLWRRQHPTLNGHLLLNHALKNPPADRSGGSAAGFNILSGPMKGLVARSRLRSP